MKKAFLLFVAFAFAMIVSSYVYAADLPKPIDKLTKGTMDVVKSPLVIVDHTKGQIDDADMKVLGLLKGLAESPFHVVKKAGHGVLNMATFPIE